MLTKHYQKIADQFTWDTMHIVQNNIKLGKGVQLTLPFIGVENCGHVKMGLFYELTTAALFGGNLADSIKYNSNGFAGTIKPDVVDPINKVAYESKSMRSGHQMNLIDAQMHRYHAFQVINPTYKIYFVFIRHGITKIHHKKITMKKLYGELSRKTYAVIAIPFNLVFTMWTGTNKIFNQAPNADKFKDIDKTTKRYQGNKAWPDCTRINSTVINDFITKPDEIITRIGRNPYNFNVHRSLTPTSLIVDRVNIEQFMVVKIEYTKYSEWANKLSNQVPF